MALADLVTEGLAQDLSDVPVDAGVTTGLPPKFEGKPFFLPFRPNVRLAYAPRARLADAGIDLPRTPDDLKHAAQRLKDVAGRPVLTLSLSDKDGGRPAAVTISELVLAFGGNPVRLNSDEVVKAFEFLQTLWHEKLLTRESLFAKHDTEIEYLEDGTSWLAQNWSVTSAELADEGRLSEFHVYPGWQGAGKHVIGGDVLGIPAGVAGAERAAAVDLARFLMSRDAQRFLVERNAWPAIRDDAYDASAPSDATIGAMKEALDGGWYRPAEPYWAAVTAAMNEAVDRIVLQGQPPRSVLDELRTQVRDGNAGYPG
ncbi:MAG: ABC transporter substrate-binding protein [Acidimicrobiales bacterium]